MEAFRKLLATADVFLHNQPSRASLQKREIDAETLCAKNPRLIYRSITAYGFTGPKAEMPGYDILAQAETGVMSFTGDPSGGPMRYPLAIADMTCGMYAAMGILAALFNREKAGRGQVLDMALFDSQLTWLANVGSSYLNAGASPQRWGNAHPNIVPSTPVSYRLPPPLLGEHTVQVLRSLGYSDEEVVRMSGSQTNPQNATTTSR